MSCAHANGEPMLEVCDCGMVYLTYGSVTLTFQYAEFVRYARNVERLADTAIKRLATTLISGEHTTQCH